MTNFAGCVGWSENEHVVVRRFQGHLQFRFYAEHKAVAEELRVLIPNDAAKSLGGLLLNAASRNK